MRSQSSATRLTNDMVDNDVVFQHAVAAADLTSIIKVLKNDSRVDTNSESFRRVLDLSMKNGEEAVFARLLSYIPDLTLRTRSQAVERSRRHLVTQAVWKSMRQLSIVVAEIYFCLFCYYALNGVLLYTVLHSSGWVREASAWCYDHLNTSASPFSVWVAYLVFYGMQKRFSRKFFLDSLDTGLVFLLLTIATRFVSQSSWIGGCIYQGKSSISMKGLQTRNVLNLYMPTWRRKYFAMILGPDHVLASSTQTNASPPQIDHCEFVLDRLLVSKCNEEALMLQYLRIVVFDNINEECGVGHKILIWAARNGYLRVVEKLLNSGIDTDTIVTNPDLSRSGWPPPGSALFNAAAAGYPDVVEVLLLNKAVVEDDDPDLSPLMGATIHSHQVYDGVIMLKYRQCVSHLLQVGANPNVVDREGRSALSWSTQPTQKHILDLLLKAGADPNITDQQLKLPLHYAARFAASQDVVRMLLAKTVDTDSVDKDGTSALTWSLWSGDCPPTMELLVDAASNLNLGGGIYGCPLGAASRYCSSKTIKVLLDKGADPNVTGGYYGSCLAALLKRPFNRQVFEDDLLCLNLLLSNGAEVNLRMNNGKQALHAAAEYCWRTEIFEMLLRYGADVNAAFQSHLLGFEVTTTPLGMLCDFHKAEEAIMVLLRAGADPNCYTPSGETVLQSTCNILGSSKIAHELIMRGADIGASSLRDGDTALHSAATAARSDVIKILIEKGSNVNARDKQEKTPLHNACWQTLDKENQREKVENHFEARARLYHMKKDSELQRSIGLLLELGHADPKARDKNGATPLHHAVKACNPVTVEALIRLTSNEIIFEKDSKEKLPLHWAAEAGFTDGLYSLIGFHSHLEAAYEFKDTEKLRAVIATLRRYINAPDQSGNTALHYAAKYGHEDFVAQLLDLGEMFTDIDARNRRGRTALDVAKKNDQMWVVAKLRDGAANIEAHRASLKEDEQILQFIKIYGSKEPGHGSEDTSWTWSEVSEKGSESDADIRD